MTAPVTAPVEENLPRVGAQATEPAQWWGEGEEPGVRGRAKGRETTTAEEEIQRFKHVPVVGRLPWRRQYLVATVGLVLGIVVMIQQAISQAHMDGQASEQMHAALMVHQGVHGVEAQATASETAKGLNAAALGAALATGTEGARSLSDPALDQAWTAFQQGAQRLPEQQKVTQAVAQQAAPIAAAIKATLPSLVDASSSLSDPSVKEVNEAWARLEDATNRVAQNGTRLEVGVINDRALIEARLRSFYASPGAQVVDARAQLWTAELALFGKVKAPFDHLVIDASALNASVGEGPLSRLAAPVSDRLDALGADLGSSAGHGRAGVWLAGVFSALCLGLLTFISTKQQRLATLEARVTSERLEGVLFDLIQQQGKIAQGDLTALSRVDDPTVGPLAEGINQTVQELRSLVRRVRLTVNKTTSVAEGVVRATHELSEDARTQLATMDTNSQDVLALSHTLQELTRQAQAARQLTDQARDAAEGSAEVVQESRGSLSTLRKRNDEAANRIRRLADVVRETAVLTQLGFDQTERMEELAIQAALHAERAGEQGQGFRVVARNMRDLAEQAKGGSERIHALVEATQADIEGGLLALRASTEQTDDASRLTDLVFEAWSQMRERLQAIQEQVTRLTEEVSDQAPVAQGLEMRTREGMEQSQRTQLHAAEASQSISPLLEVVQELGESLKRFQV